MKRFSPRNGFTLIELITVIAIISLLASLSIPGFKKALDQANTMRCANNLRQIGIAVLNATHENDNKYPKMNNPLPFQQYYTEEDPPIKNMVDVLTPYGVDTTTFRCPSDMKGLREFDKYGTSYMWMPLADDEVATSDINMYGRSRGGGQATPMVFQRSSARVQIVTDIDAVHSNRMNVLYADGHVRYK